MLSWVYRVLDFSLLRDLINSATEIVNQGYDDCEEVETLLDRAETSIFTISEKKSKQSEKNLKNRKKSPV